MPSHKPYPSPGRTNRLPYPAAARLARVIVAVIDAPEDPRSFEAWGTIVGASRGALRDWCRAAGVRGRDALSFARTLRAVYHAKVESEVSGVPGPLEAFLDIISDRRRHMHLVRAGVADKQVIAIEAFLRIQRIIQDDRLIDAIEELCKARGLTSTPVDKSNTWFNT